ncbi:MAG: RND transporter [Lentisphaerae bacterium GWF2_44_16]|nr:MAG: RND transporter [Lentisphaerae bacterium GWF2_44_16]
MNFFIKRPIFAAAIALITVLAGAICMLVLPVAQFPPLVPPQVQVTTQYIGASSDVVANTVTTPLEEQVNGAAGMIYMTSNSTNNGDSLITITFDVGYSEDIGQMEILTQSNQALSQLPSDVKQVGLTIQKHSTNMLMAVNLISPKGTYDARFLQNYADIHITDALSRIPGVASVTNFGLSQYAMRIWLDPQKLNNMGLTATDVQSAVQEQNQQVAAGALGQSPAPKSQVFQYQLNTLGRLDQVSQFEDIIVKAMSDGRIVRVRDIARVELGAEEYDWDTKVDGRPTATIIVFQLPNANGLQIKKDVVKTMNSLQKHFPEDVQWRIFHDTTEFIRDSINEVVITLIEAIILVILVVYIFLQNFRATLIPTIAVPVSLIGAFIFMAVLRFSINTLSLLGLVLAVALVVDDAIVVVENVMRKVNETPDKDLKEITADAIREVRGPIIATTLVLMAVFVPVAFIPGMTGMLYNQFSLTIAISVGLSGINSLTLSPALCGVFLKVNKEKSNIFFKAFNKSFHHLTEFYAATVRKMARFWYLSMAVFLGLCVFTGFCFTSIPTGFVPSEDQGYFFVMAGLPEGQTIDRTKDVMAQIRKLVEKEPGVDHVLEISGYNIIDSIKQPYTGFSIIILKPWKERKSKEMQLDAIMGGIQKKVSVIPDARILVTNAPAIPGLGSTGGFTFAIEDLNGQGIQALSNVANNFIAATRKEPELTGVYTTFNAATPQRYLDIDRTKAKTLQVSLNDLFSTLQINLGSLYVNQFNKFGRVYRVYLQAEENSRSDERDIGRLKVRNSKGEMIDISALIKIKPMVGPYNISHYNEYNSISLNGANAPGFSTGQAINAMEKLAAKILPEGFGYEWTNITYQQLKAGDLAPIIFALSLVFVFLVLAAQYESWSMPIMVLLGVPLGLMGAVLALLLRRMDLDVYGQIGLVMLIGLTAKNGILIVEFASDLRRKGSSVMDATIQAAKIRLRPILMTALAFVIGLIPLVVASGAGARSRQSLGTSVVGGLAVATALIIFVPVFYYVIERIRERKEEKSSPAENIQAADGLKGIEK